MNMILLLSVLCLYARKRKRLVEKVSEYLVKVTAKIAPDKVDFSDERSLLDSRDCIKELLDEFEAKIDCKFYI